jgi:hypothetical protein
MSFLDIPLGLTWIAALAKVISAIAITVLAAVMFRRFAANKNRLTFWWAMMFTLYASGAWITSIYSVIVLFNPAFPNATISTVLCGSLFGIGTLFLARFVIEVYGGARTKVWIRAGLYPLVVLICLAAALAIGIWIGTQVIWTLGGYILILLAAVVYLIVLAGTLKIARRLKTNPLTDSREGDLRRVVAMMKGSLAAFVWFVCSVVDAILTPLPYYTWLNPIGWVAMIFAMVWYYKAYERPSLE